MNRHVTSAHSVRGSERGQIIVLAALAMVTIIGGVSLVIEAGNAYAQQRVAQNGVDSVANAGATVIAQKIGGGTRTDADVVAAMGAMATENDLDGYTAYYTNVTGEHAHARQRRDDARPSLGRARRRRHDPGRTPRACASAAARPSARRSPASSASTSSRPRRTRRPSPALSPAACSCPIVFPVAMKDCDGTGELTPVDAPWRMSNPGTPHPVGQECIVPLCKTGGGSFMILDLDPDKRLHRRGHEPVLDPVPRLPGRRPHGHRQRLREEGRGGRWTSRTSRARSS